MATFQTLRFPRSPFFDGRLPSKPTSFAQKYPKLRAIKAKFNVLELLGGRGLCQGEKGIRKELKRTVEPVIPAVEDPSPATDTDGENEAEDGFGKELMGLTGGFPGGEKGLKKFIKENPPPKKMAAKLGDMLSTIGKPKAPELPVLLPGMVAIVKNENSPYYMYCGIVQRITDGKVGVLFEGGNWDRLITFRIEELQRRDKGPPGKNPKSVVLEIVN